MNPLLHPFTIFFASPIALTFTAAYTARSSPLRYATLAFLALCAYQLPFSLASFAGTTGWIGRVPAGAMAWNLILCFDRLIVKAWDYDHYEASTGTKQEIEHSSKAQKTNGSQYHGTRMDFGSEATGSQRGVGLFWEVKNVPQFASMRPRFVPALGTLVLVQSVAIVCCYYLHNAAVEAMLGVDHRYLDADRVPLLTRLSEVSIPELKGRSIASIGYWIVQYCLIQFFYSIFTIVGAISNPRDLKLWRPLFDSPSHAYTIRNFWGKSWHQNLRSGCEGISNFVAGDVLLLPRQGLLQRYTKIMCSFAVSGIMHAMADRGGGMSLKDSGAMQFFCMQAVGIIIEDSVQAIYTQYFECTSGSNMPVLFTRLIGYTWVLAFLVWTTPVWVFPAILNMRKDDALLSFDAAKPFFIGRSTGH